MSNLPHAAAPNPKPPLPLTALAALGVVYGDLGASPLYTMRTIVGVLGPHAAAAGLGAPNML